MPGELRSLACHAGKSSIRVRVIADADVRELTAPGLIIDSPVVPQLVAVIGEALGGRRIDGPVAVATVGHGPGTARELLAQLEPAGASRVVSTHAVVGDYLGAFGPTPGVVSVADLGAACMAVGPREAARVDGWGPLIGSAGSAFWIGRTGLEAATRGYDGRRQMTALTAAMTDMFGDIESAYPELLGTAAYYRIAAFADRVMDLAGTDRVAGNILDKAAAHLSEAVQAGVRRAGLSGPETPRVAALGRVFACRHVLTRFTDYLSLQWPAFALVEPEADGLAGTAQLLELGDQPALASQVCVAQA